MWPVILQHFASFTGCRSSTVSSSNSQFFTHQVITQRCPSYIADLVAFRSSDPQRRSLRRLVPPSLDVRALNWDDVRSQSKVLTFGQGRIDLSGIEISGQSVHRFRGAFRKKVQNWWGLMCTCVHVCTLDNPALRLEQSATISTHHDLSICFSPFAKDSLLQFSIFIMIFSERELKFMFAICHRPSVCLSSVVCLSVCRL